MTDVQRTDATLGIALLVLGLAGCIEDGAGAIFGDADVGPDGVADSGSEPDVFDVSDSDPDAVEVVDAIADPDVLEVADAGADIEPEVGPSPPPRPAISTARLASLQDAMDAAFEDVLAAGWDLTALVVDESGRTLYEVEPELALIPASNTKLFTTAAAFALLGEDYRFRSRVFASAAPNGGAVAELTLLVEHDLSFSSEGYGSPRFPFDRLAAELHAAGLREVTETVRLSGELFYTGSSVGTYNAQEQRDLGVAALSAALAAAGIDVGGASTETSPSLEEPGGVELAEWLSLPLAVATSPINRASHNQQADILLRHLGWIYGETSSYAVGFAEVAAWLEASGFDRAGLSLSDGSGLSYENRVSARHIVDLYALMAEQPAGPAWLRTMSVGGVRGTMASRLTGEDTVGRVFAKSGSLNVTIATSGVVVNRYDGRSYVFSFILNEPSIDQPRARSAMDAAITALGGDLLETGGRPAMPAIEWVRGIGDGIEVRWQPVSVADGYFVWTSPDGVRWDREDAVYVVEPLAVLEAAEPVFARVSAVNAAGESDVSSVYSAHSTDGAATVLLVDGNERWQAQPVPENTLGAGHAFMVEYAEVLEATYDTASAEVVRDGRIELSDYDAVIWATGEDAATDESFDASEQALLAAYTAGGGNLFASGAEIGWDLVAQGTESDTAFFADVLRAAYVGDDSGTYFVAGSGGAFDDLPLMGFFTPDELVVSYPDRLGTAGSVEVLQYVGGTGGVAGVLYDGDYRLILLGFPFECLALRSDREALMARSLAFLGSGD